MAEFNESDTQATTYDPGTGNVLSTANCTLDVGGYSQYLTTVKHELRDIEAVLKIPSDLRTLTTEFDPGNTKTYYKFTGTNDDDEAVRYHDEAENGVTGFLSKFGIYFISGTDTTALTAASPLYSKQIIDKIMHRMFHKQGEPDQFLRTQLFSEDAVTANLLTAANFAMLKKCALKGWLEPSTVGADRDFITAHIGADSSTFGYSVDEDNIVEGDMLVLNIRFQPNLDQTDGFVGIDRILRVEFIHTTNLGGTTNGGDWSKLNQFVSSVVAGEDVIADAVAKGFVANGLTTVVTLTNLFTDLDVQFVAGDYVSFRGEPDVKYEVLSYEDSDSAGLGKLTLNHSDVHLEKTFLDIVKPIDSAAVRAI